jgi:hypothetical protein
MAGLNLADRPWLGLGTRSAAAELSFTGHAQRVSRCNVCVRHQRQYFRNSTRSGVFRLDLLVW